MERVALEKAPSRIAGMFDAIAGRYDFLNHFLSAGFDRRWRARAIEALRLRESDVMLDLCTGTADLALSAVTRSAGPRLRVIGIDFAREMLRIGQSKVREEGLARQIRLIRGDASSLPLPAGSVDAVGIAFGIRNVERPEVAIEEIHRVLRPGGRLAILEFGVPRGSFLRGMYRFYFDRLLPRIGRLVSRHPEAYSYLPASVSAFPSGEQFAALLTARGFSSVSFVPLTLGIVYLYTAQRG